MATAVKMSKINFDIIDTKINEKYKTDARSFYHYLTQEIKMKFQKRKVDILQLERDYIFTDR